MGFYEYFFGEDKPEDDLEKTQEGIGYGELILDNVVGLDNEYDSFGEKLGRYINEDEIGFLKETGMGMYEGAKDFVQAPIETTKEAVRDVADSTKALFTQDIDDRLMDMYGVDITNATGDQITAARESILSDALNASSLIPAAGAGAMGVRAVARNMPEYDPTMVGSNLGNMFSGEMPPASNAQKTQIAGTLPTYMKADTLLTDLSGEGKTLDYGAGLGLSQRELGYDTFEPFPRAGFEPTYSAGTDIPDSSYGRITNLNVLNVVPRETRDSIVLDIGRILEPNGTAIITTRGRDVLNAKGTAGPEDMSIITSAGTYQKGFTQKELREYIQDTLGDNFEVTNNPLGAAGVTIRKKSSGSVPASVVTQTEEMLDIDRRVDTRLPTTP